MYKPEYAQSKREYVKPLKADYAKHTWLSTADNIIVAFWQLVNSCSCRPSLSCGSQCHVCTPSAPWPTMVQTIRCHLSFRHAPQLMSSECDCWPTASTVDSMWHMLLLTMATWEVWTGAIEAHPDPTCTARYLLPSRQAHCHGYRLRLCPGPSAHWPTQALARLLPGCSSI